MTEFLRDWAAIGFGAEMELLITDFHNPFAWALTPILFIAFVVLRVKASSR